MGKFEKTSTASSAYKVHINSLGTNISYLNSDGSIKYFKVDFKIYVDGDGLEYAVPCNYWQSPLATPVSVKGSTPYNSYSADYQKPIACLEPDSWNDVTYVFRLTDQYAEGNYTYYTTYSDIYVNGKMVVTDSEYKRACSIGSAYQTSITDGDNIGVYFAMISKYDSTASQTFTAYLDDLGLTTHSENPVTVPALAEGELYEISGSTVYVITGTKVSDLNAGEGETVVVYSGGSELADDSVISEGDTVVVTNTDGIYAEYTAEIPETEVTASQGDIVYSTDGQITYNRMNRYGEELNKAVYAYPVEIKNTTGNTVNAASALALYDKMILC